MTELPTLPGPPWLAPGSWTVLATVMALLLAGTLWRGVNVWLRRGEDSVESRWRSLATWWALFAVFLTVVLVGRWAVVFAAGVLSLALLREALRLAELEAAYWAGALLAAAYYAWAWMGGRAFFHGPGLVLAGILLVLTQVERLPGNHGSARVSALARIGLLSVVGPSFTVAVASLPAPPELPGEELGWLVLLVVLTELNDSAQAWWGRALGSHALAPRLSPGKTWEGLAGGVATTTAVAVLLAPALTRFGRSVPPGMPDSIPPWMWGAALGAFVSLSGLAGDLTASYQKRRAGVKDSGDVLPGHGGVLDRFDSLALTAPTFFLFTTLLWGP